MKGLLPEGTGLDGFIGGVVAQRDTDFETMLEAQYRADAVLWEAGIQAVGDICNTTDTVEVKSASRIRYHSFIELLGLSPERAEFVFERGKRLAGKFTEAGLPATLVPHAPYSVSQPLFRFIAERAVEFGSSVSIHSQETRTEDEMFIHGTGALMDKLRSLGIPMDGFVPSGKRSLLTVLPWMAACARIILVHNTFTTVDDMRWANAQHQGLFWCTCPSANLYIEQQIPKVDQWLRNGARACIGTDSLASNHQLSIFEEMKLLAKHCPSISFDDLLRMATLNGAMALGMENEAGTLEKSKMPGLLLLENIHPQHPKLTESVLVRRLV